MQRKRLYIVLIEVPGVLILFAKLLIYTCVCVHVMYVRHALCFFSLSLQS